MAYHADYDKYIWDYGFPNEDKDHQRMCIIPANGEFGTLRGARSRDGGLGSDWRGD